MKIITGDCLKVWPDVSPKAIITDPPYGIGYQGHNGTAEDARSDSVVDWLPIQNDLIPFLDWLPLAFESLQTGGVLYLNTRWDVEPLWREALIRVGFKVKGRLTWNKRVHGKGDLKGTFRSDTEDVLFATKGRHILNSRPSSILDVGCVPTWEKRLHPHQKPVDLAKALIKVSTKPGDLVLDPFCGSGSTGVACKDLGRDFLGIELESSYAKVARLRIKAHKVVPPSKSRPV